jgi:RNA-binding protein
MPLNVKKKQEFKKKSHHLQPVVMIGQHGLTANVISEIDIALLAHELIKIKIAENDRHLRKQMIEQICEQTQSEFINAIGKVAVIYREKPKS